MSRKFKILISLTVLLGVSLTVHELWIKHLNSPAFAKLQDFNPPPRKRVVYTESGNVFGPAGPLDVTIAKHEESPLQQYFTFEGGLKEPFSPFNVVVSLKKEFKGTAVFYSCDMEELMLLEVDTGEFINKITYKIHASSGQVLTLAAEYRSRRHPNIVFGTPPICGEVNPAGQFHPFTKPHVKELAIEVFDPKGEEYSVEELLNSLILHDLILPDDSFAVARAKKLLKIFPQEKVSTVLTELIYWVPSIDKQSSIFGLMKIIIGRFGGKEAAPLLVRHLKSVDSQTRITALELLEICGNDAIAVAPQIKELLISEKDDDTLSIAVRLAKRLKIERPLKCLSPDEVPTMDTERYKKEITAACEEAASLDLTEKDDFQSYYDSNGRRITVPDNIQQIISRLDGLIERMPNYPEMARVYLLAGMLRQKYQDWYHAVENQKRDDTPQPPPEIEKIAQDQYIIWESGDSYHYNSWHFKRLLKLFPDSSLVPDAEYEMASKGFVGGESEDDTTGLYSTIDPLMDFLKKYPTSKPALRAVNRINTEYNRFTVYFRKAGYDFKVDKPGYSASEFVSRIAKYEAISKKLPLTERALALDKVSALWEMVGQKNKAKAAAE